MLATDFWAQWADLVDAAYQVRNGAWTLIEGDPNESHDYGQHGLNWSRLLTHENWVLRRFGNTITIQDEHGKAVSLESFRETQP